MGETSPQVSQSPYTLPQTAKGPKKVLTTALVHHCHMILGSVCLIAILFNRVVSLLVDYKFYLTLSPDFDQKS